MRASGLLNFRKVRSTNPSPSPREYDTGSNPIEITIIIRVHCVYAWNKEGGMEGEGERGRQRKRERKREEKEKREDELCRKSCRLLSFDLVRSNERSALILCFVY
jgi:hypothetical protein